MEYIMLAVFAVSSVIHLYASLKSNIKLRAQSKAFILAALCGWYVFASASPSWLVIAALLFSWLGDVLLIPKGIKWFAAGGVAFVISHVSFVVAYCQNISFAGLPIAAVIAAAAVYLAASLLVFKGLKGSLPKALFFPMFGYLLLNGTMNCFALFQLLSLKNAAGLIVYIGATLFFASDSLLFYVRFKKNTRIKNHFPVMLTYIIGEFLITLGLMLIAA